MERSEQHDTLRQAAHSMAQRDYDDMRPLHEALGQSNVPHAIRGEAIYRVLRDPQDTDGFSHVAMAILDEKHAALSAADPDIPGFNPTQLAGSLFDTAAQPSPAEVAQYHHRYSAAAALADSLHITPDKVFADDQLYGELMGTLYSPATFTSEALHNLRTAAENVTIATICSLEGQVVADPASLPLPERKRIVGSAMQVIRDPGFMEPLLAQLNHIDHLLTDNVIHRTLTYWDAETAMASLETSGVIEQIASYNLLRAAMHRLYDMVTSD